jgi:histone H3/H4
MAVIVKSKIKEIVELNISSDVAQELEKQVEDMLKKAEERAKANGRRTIYARDV